jgi:hypothetical protein
MPLSKRSSHERRRAARWSDYVSGAQAGLSGPREVRGTALLWAAEVVKRPNYSQSERQNPPPPSARPRAPFLGRRAARRGLPLAITLMLLEIRAAR